VFSRRTHTVDENNQKTKNKKNMGKRTKNLRGGPPGMDVICMARMLSQIKTEERPNRTKKAFTR
jgi:hypothetical protein